MTNGLRAAHGVSAVEAFVARAVADGDGAADIACGGIVLEMLELGAEIFEGLSLSLQESSLGLVNNSNDKLSVRPGKSISIIEWEIIFGLSFDYRAAFFGFLVYEKLSSAGIAVQGKLLEKPLPLDCDFKVIAEFSTPMITNAIIQLWYTGSARADMADEKT